MPSYRCNIAGTPKQCIRTFYVPIQASIAERPIVLIVSGAVSVVWHDAFYEFELYLAADPQLQHLLDHVRATMGSIQHQPCPPEGIRCRRITANQDKELHAHNVASLTLMQKKKRSGREILFSEDHPYDCSAPPTAPGLLS